MSANGNIGSLFGENKNTPAADDKDKRIADLERQLNSAKADNGRWAKVNERLKELEKENEALKASRRSENIVTSLKGELGEVPDEFAGAAAKIAGRAVDGAMKDVNEELARLRQEREAERAASLERAKEDFIRKIDAKYPKFRSDVDGGDEVKTKAWRNFLGHNLGSVKDAYERCDFDSLAYHIDRFYREELDRTPPNGNREPTSPDPTNRGGGTSVIIGDSSKIYTTEEYQALEAKATSLRYQPGKYADYQKLRDELDNIISEGRVRDE